MTFGDWRLLAPEAAARELRRRVETRLSAVQHRAVIAVIRDEPALEAAFRSAPASRPLRGVPYFQKDLFDVGGMPTFAGSSFLPEARPAPAGDGRMARDLAEAGAVLAGKTHLFEFACGLTGENVHYGDCEHPGFAGRTSGGSSSGSAAAVAAGVVPFATGTDTGGSIRVPAAFCGIYGYRGIPRDPRIADAVLLAPSFDAPGWFTADAGDMRTALEALVGLAPGERTPRGAYLEMPGIDPDVAAACRRAAAAFAPPVDPSTGAELLDRFASASEIYGVLTGVEAWRIHKAWVGRFRGRYGPLVLERLDRARAVSPAQVAAVQPGWEALKRAWTHLFESLDFLILPAVPFAAPTKAGCTHANRLRMLALTAPASLAGLPALTIPVPLESGLTAGLQVVAARPDSAVFGGLLGQIAAGQSSA